MDTPRSWLTGAAQLAARHATRRGVAPAFKKKRVPNARRGHAVAPGRRGSTCAPRVHAARRRPSQPVTSPWGGVREKRLRRTKHDSARETHNPRSACGLARAQRQLRNAAAARERRRGCAVRLASRERQKRAGARGPHLPLSHHQARVSRRGQRQGYARRSARFPLSAPRSTKLLQTPRARPSPANLQPAVPTRQEPGTSNTRRDREQVTHFRFYEKMRNTKEEHQASS